MISKLISKLAKKGAKGSTSQERAWLFLLWGALLLLIVDVVYAFVYEYLLGHQKSAPFFAMAVPVLLGVLASPFIVTNPLPIAHILALTFFAVEYGLTITTGGILAFNLPWFGLVPLFALFVSGWQSAVFWCAVVIATLVYFLLSAMEGYHYPIGTYFGPGSLEWHMATTLTNIGFMIVVTACLVFFEITKEKALYKSEQAKHETVETLNVLQKTVANMVTAISSTFNISKDVSAHAHTLNNGVKQQTQHFKELNQEANQVAEHLHEDHCTAKNLTEMAANAQAGAEHGEQVIKNALSQMDLVANAVIELANSIEALEKRSAQISNIVELISSIADKTNLLALNAAIEAARAGEYGRGFAVVADEIRRLADQTHTSTNEISELINGIAETVTCATTLMECTRTRTFQASQNAADSLNSIDQITVQSSVLFNSIHQLSDNSDKHANSSRAIASKLERLTHSTTELFESVATIDSAASELLTVAHELDTLKRNIQFSYSINS